MAERGQLGAFWDKDALYFVETISKNPVRLFHVPFTEEAQGSIEGGPLSPVGMELVSLIQNALRQHKSASTAVYLSLPSKDIIFRSFIIPWMQPSEISGVVDFEASKYVPFALEELSYSFHPVTVTENGARRIRIIFVAIKKIILESYTKILEQSSLNVHLVEPGTLSLIRTLMLKDSMINDRTVALIEKGEESGNITVIDQGLPQFVREFQLRIPVADQQEIDAEALMTRLMNEIRISLNYFNRQEERLQVKDVILLTPSGSEETVARMGEDLHMPITPRTAESILGADPFCHIGFLKAYGASLIGAVNTPADFNLVEGKPKVIKLSIPSARKPLNYKLMMKVALVCVPLIAAAVLLPRLLIQGQQKQLAVLTQKLSSSKGGLVAAQLKKETEGLSKKLDHLRGIRSGSDVSRLLAVIPALLPEGAWIERLGISYGDSLPPKKEEKKSAKGGKKPAADAQPVKKTPPAKEMKPVVSLEGYAYSPNPNEQFNLVNDVLRNFKSNKELSAFFANIDLKVVQARKMGKYPVTYFLLNCE